MGIQLHRIEPKMAPHRYKTFQITAPLKTHFRPAKSCEEVACANWLNGWKTIVDPSTTEGQYHMETINLHLRTHKYTTERLPDGRIAYTFEPGQNCFKLSRHRVRLEREERFFTRSGDYRQLGHPTELRADQWQEDFAINQEAVQERLQKG